MKYDDVMVQGNFYGPCVCWTTWVLTWEGSYCTGLYTYG